MQVLDGEVAMKAVLRNRYFGALSALFLLGGMGLAVDARPALAQPADRCSATFIGLHGLNEDATSKTIHATWDEFAKQMLGRGQPASAIFLNHPTLTFTDLMSGIMQPQDRSPIVQAGDYLTEAAIHAASDCQPARLVLVGYSEGAWIIDEWLHTAEAATKSQIVAVAVFGDPQWTRQDYSGLARRFGLGLDPYVPPDILDRFIGYCAGGDPICGEGYGNSAAEFTRQVQDTYNLQNNCALHCAYIPGATKPVADFLVSKASA